MASEAEALLASNPAFARKVHQFMMLHDAAAVLDELKPPHGDTAAGFLREVGNHVMRETGVPEEFLDAMIAARPPVEPLVSAGTPASPPSPAGA